MPLAGTRRTKSPCFVLGCRFVGRAAVLVCCHGIFFPVPRADRSDRSSRRLVCAAGKSEMIVLLRFGTEFKPLGSLCVFRCSAFSSFSHVFLVFSPVFPRGLWEEAPGLVLPCA